jgi:hypothetical protein
MNALLAKPTQAYAMCVTVSDSGKRVSRFQGSSLASWTSSLAHLALRKNSIAGWMHRLSNPHIAHFPELISAEGEGIFHAYWRRPGRETDLND